MSENQIIEQVNLISNNWENFKQEYKDMKKQVSQMQTALNRPLHSDVAFDMEKSAATDYLRKGEVKMEFKDQFSSSQDSGGGLILPSLCNEIISNIQAISPIRKLASVDRISTNELDIIIEDQEFETGWVSEIGERRETKTPKLKQKKILVHELYAQPMATQRLIDDSSIDIYNWISDRLVDYFAHVENHAFIHGDGDNKPKGILAAENIQSIKAQEEEKINIEDILKLINSLGEHHLAKASFLMHRSTLSYIQTLKDDAGRFIWQPSYSDLQPQTLFGIPLYCCDDMPTIEKGKKAIAVGNFKAAYKIVDRQDIYIMRDPYTHKPFVKFYAVKRVGADVVNTAAIKLLEC
jgi:HK97 family phage major capsid protein